MGPRPSRISNQFWFANTSLLKVFDSLPVAKRQSSDPIVALEFVLFLLRIGSSCQLIAQPVDAYSPVADDIDRLLEELPLASSEV